QVPSPVVLQQGDGFHTFTALKRSLIDNDRRVSFDRRGRSLLFTSALQTSDLHVAKFFAQFVKSRFGLVERSRVTPFIRGFVIELFVTAGINIFERGVERLLGAGRYAAAARSLTTARA